MDTNHSNHVQRGHDYHLVNPSPWPLAGAFSLLILAIGATLFIHHYPLGNIVLPLGFGLILYVMYGWWRDVIKEGAKDKAHTEIVQKGLRIGMALFILSEVVFFGAFFMSYFHSEIFPPKVLDGLWPIGEDSWPPKNITKLDAWNIPLMNTLILLLSGTTVTWAHHALLENNRKELIQGLAISVALGVTFSLLQAFEYHHAEFGFKDGVYPSNFYMATGFHGAHVLIGTLFLAVCLFRAIKGNFSSDKGHLGFEFAAWYWHFVDVVWLFLFIFIYIG